jgi:copper ion binding protein
LKLGPALTLSQNPFFEMASNEISMMVEQKITLPITGMTCANCAMSIERRVKKLHGVTEVSVNFASEQAAIRFDSGVLTIKDLVDTIHRSGYTVATAKIELPITGMSCANCAANIERVLTKKNNGYCHCIRKFCHGTTDSGSCRRSASAF